MFWMNISLGLFFLQRDSNSIEAAEKNKKNS